MSHEEHFSPVTDVGQPISVIGMSVSQVTKLSIGTAIDNPKEASTGFWESLHSLGGRWMWDKIESGKGTLADVLWIADSLRNVSLV